MALFGRTHLNAAIVLSRSEFDGKGHVTAPFESTDSDRVDGNVNP